jgi:hypothetical protein
VMFSNVEDFADDALVRFLKHHKQEEKECSKNM